MDEGVPEFTSGQTEDVQQQQKHNITNNSFNGIQPLDFPTVLHFLHQEWRRFESERNQWELEKNELRSKVAVLEGEKRGFEVLKIDLLRRIKMLEYALRRERVKNLSNTPNSVNIDATKAEVAQPKQQENAVTKISSYSAATLGKTLTLGKSSRTGTSRTKEILKQYLHEVGFDEKNADDLQWMKGKFQTLNTASSSTAARSNNITIDKLFQQSEQTPVQSPNTPNAQDEKKTRRQKVTDSIIYSGEDLDRIEDLSKEMSNEGDAWATIFHSSSKEKMTKVAKKGDGFFNNASKPMDNELADLLIDDKSLDAEDSEEHPTKNAPVVETTRLWHPKFTLRSHLDVITGMAFHPTDLQLFTASEDGCVKLWNLESVANMKKSPTDFEPQFVYRCAHNYVTSLAVCTMIPPEAEMSVQEQLQNGCMFSGGSDGIISIWGLPERSLQPYSKYDYKRYHVSDLNKHSDVIWDIKLHPLRPLMVSLSADGNVNCWDLNMAVSDSSKALRSTINEQKSQPTSCDFLHTDANKLLVSYDNSQVKLFDIESQKLVMKFEGSDSSYDGTRLTQINKIISHNACPLVVSAHEDRYIRFYDPRGGKSVHGMVAHLDAVSSIDISPNGLVLVSGGHDGSTRLWEIASYSCLQEFTFHRKKFDESIHSVLFHPRIIANSQAAASTNVSGGSGWLATGGADACAKVYSCQ